MKTLLESIINELKITQAHTGEKLEEEKKFEDLKPGDKLYWITDTETMETAVYTVDDVIVNTSKNTELDTPVDMHIMFTSKNPVSKKGVVQNVVITVLTDTGLMDTTKVPKGCTWAILTTRGGRFDAWATTKERLKSIVQRYADKKL